MVEWAYAFGVYERLGGPAITIAESYESEHDRPARPGRAGVVLRHRLGRADTCCGASSPWPAASWRRRSSWPRWPPSCWPTRRATSTARSTRWARCRGHCCRPARANRHPTTPSTPTPSSQPLQAHLHQAFVEDPYDHLNWGGSDMPTECRGMRDRILALGPWGNSDAPRDAMEMAGCQDAGRVQPRPQRPAPLRRGAHDDRGAGDGRADRPRVAHDRGGADRGGGPLRRRALRRARCDPHRRRAHAWRSGGSRP